MALTRAIHPKWLGRISYGNALKMQEDLVSLHKTSLETKNTVLLLDHPPTYTVGKRGQMYDDSFADYLRELGHRSKLSC
jgi:lipoate-protein ligase B